MGIIAVVSPKPRTRPRTTHARSSLDDASTADESDQEQHDRHDQQYVNEVAQGVTADHAQQPQHDQNDRNRFQHVLPPILRALGCNAGASLYWDPARLFPGRGVWWLGRD